MRSPLDRPLPPLRAVTFDFGQTLCDLDTAMLARRLGERGLTVTAQHLEDAVPAAWRTYDAAIHAGFGGHPWKILMARLLELGGVADPGARTDAVDWLWDEQPKQNLWRRPIEGMIELVDALAARGLGVGVISNSEGGLAELIDEIGWAGRFAVVADSGKLGLEKPGPEIFAWTTSRLGVDAAELAHVGDSLAADVEGALGAGIRAIWFRGREPARRPEGVPVAEDAEGVWTALQAWGVRRG